MAKTADDFYKRFLVLSNNKNKKESSIELIAKEMIEEIPSDISAEDVGKLFDVWDEFIKLLKQGGIQTQRKGGDAFLETLGRTKVDVYQMWVKAHRPEAPKTGTRSRGPRRI